MTKAKTKNEYFNSLSEVSDLRIFSPVFQRMREVANNPESSAADLANVILHDHGFTSRILKTANSSYYHYKGKITTLTSAIVVMGFKAIRNLALSVSVFDSFRNREKSEKFDFRNFWVHSLAVAITAHWLAEKDESTSNEEAFVSGFLHDIGKLIISTFTPKDYDVIADNVSKGFRPLQAELQQIGMHHTEVGVYIGKKWDFPGVLLKVIRDHHSHVLTRSRTILDIVYYSNLLVNNSDILKGEILFKKEQLLWMGKKFFDLSPESLEAFMVKLHDSIEETAMELDIPLSGEYDEEAPAHVEKPGITEQVLIKEQENLRQRKLAIERERQLSLNLMQTYYHMEKIEDILLALAEGMFREMQIELVLVLHVDKKKAYLEGGVGFGIDWQEKVKNLNYNLKKQRNAFTETVLDNDIIQVLDTNHKAYKSRIDPNFVKVFEVTQFVTFPFTVWGEVEAVIVTGFSNDEAMISDELINAVKGLTFQAGMAVERIQHKK